MPTKAASQLLYGTPYPESGLDELFAGPTELIRAIRGIPENEGFYRGQTESALKWAVTQALPKEGAVRRNVSDTLCQSVLRAAKNRLRPQDHNVFKKEFLAAIGQSEEGEEKEQANQAKAWTHAWPLNTLVRTAQIHCKNVEELEGSNLLHMAADAMLYGTRNGHSRPLITFVVEDHIGAQDLFFALRAKLRTVYNSTIPGPLQMDEDRTDRVIRWLINMDGCLTVQTAPARSIGEPLAIIESETGDLSYSTKRRAPMADLLSLAQQYERLQVQPAALDREDYGELQ